MTDAEINRRLAEAMKWVLVDHEMFGDAAVWLDLETGYPVIAVADFSPSTDSNHLREYVLPEVERRRLDFEFAREVISYTGTSTGDPEIEVAEALKLSPIDLARAALKVMEG